MSRIVFIGSVFFLAGILFFVVKIQQDDSEKEIVETEMGFPNSTIKRPDNSINETTKKNLEREQYERNLEKIVTEFGEKWVNYNSIYERNQSVKSLLTEACIQSNNIDDDPKVIYKAIGKIDSISQDRQNRLRFILIGTEEYKQVSATIMIQLTINKEQLKINEINVYHVRLGG